MANIQNSTALPSGASTDIHAYLLRHLEGEAAQMWGECDRNYLVKVADDWLDTTGKSGSSYRLEKIRTLFPAAGRILDMGAGCGTFVHYALLEGFDAYGIEPEAWKRAVFARMNNFRHLPVLWRSHMTAGTGETLPFADNSFNCVTTFQTIEHVQNVAACCLEMLRVTAPGGGIHLRCPDYSWSTYEGHYRLPWMPGLKGRLAQWYLTLCRKPIVGMRSLQLVSEKKLRTMFLSAARQSGTVIRVENVDYLRVRRLFHLPGGWIGYMLTRPVFLIHFFRLLFRSDYAVHLAVWVDKKN